MFFSIIVPMYKVEAYLSRCIDSVINQDFEDYELILVDDGSPDDSGKIADTYANKKTKIKVIHKVNGGLSDARNSGLLSSKGEYVIFLDADDILLPNSLSIAQAKINQFKNCDVYYVKIVRKTNENIENIRKQNLIPERLYTGKDALKEELKASGKYMAMAQCGIYQHDFLMRNNFFFKKGILHEDEQWSPRVELAAEKVMYLDVELYGYIIRNGSITQSGNKLKNAKDILATCSELRESYQLITDAELKRELLCYLAKLYMHAISILIREEITIHIDRSYFKRTWITYKDFVRFGIFRICPKIYARIIDAHFIK